MSNFFSTPTVNSWDEPVFELTAAGIVTVVILIALLIVCSVLFLQKKERSARLATKQLVFSGVAMALAIVTSEIKFARLPFGGSITLFSMLFIVLIGYWYGAAAGLMTGFAYGLLQFVLDPVFYTPFQLLVDYPLAFGALGLSGFFCNRKHGLLIGYVVGVFARYVFAFLSGVLFFGAYASDQSPIGIIVYSLGYNATYIVPEVVVTLILLAIPAVSDAMKRVRTLARESL
ncbi:MAG: proton-coupled thiamine transporter YuaJ [Lachnospiraceae bacterium]|nr:proton-coupled thiamine transporter YuaJ [Lachnospiraceae bacterium]